MGNYLSEYVWGKSDSCNTMKDGDDQNTGSGFFSLKRKASDRPADSDDQPAKVLKLDTAKYLHRKLFLDGRDSDVTIVALGREW